MNDHRVVVFNGLGYAVASTEPSAGKFADPATDARRGMLAAVKRLWDHLPTRRKTQIWALFALSLLSSLLEVLSLGLLFPLLGLLALPLDESDNPLVKYLVDVLGSDTSSLIGVILLGFCICAVFAGAVRLAVLYCSNRFSFSLASELGERVYRKSLFEPYVEHLSRDSSTIIDLAMTKAPNVALSVVAGILLLCTSLVVGSGILIAILVTNPALAVGTAVVFGSMYLAISVISRAQLRRNSEIVAENAIRSIRSLQEGLGGIRDVIIDGTQAQYLKSFREADRPVKAAFARNVVISGAPRFVVETLGMIIIAILAYGLSQSDGGLAGAIPTLGVLALGAQRLLPMLQQSYGALSNIRGNEASLWDLLDHLDRREAAPSPEGKLPFKREVQLEEVRFRYPASETLVLDGLDLIIPKGTRIGIFGPTGGGKSTTLDVTMGLLSPESGRLVVDGVTVTAANQALWRRNIAHVPQTIFLADTSIAENIAFGSDAADIDMDRVKEAAKKAQLHATVESWPQGYQTRVGERGVRLSGGQRQRIGIARALYKRAQLIILDEATSALDNETEAALISAIELLGSEVTVLMVAHRLTTLRNCTFIVEVADGKIKRIGSYADLIGS